MRSVFAIRFAATGELGKAHHAVQRTKIFTSKKKDLKKIGRFFCAYFLTVRFSLSLL